jgi:hypothetical protein
MFTTGNYAHASAKRNLTFACSVGKWDGITPVRPLPGT